MAISTTISQAITPKTNQPGYFRIGFVVLQIPPVDITTNKVINDDQIATLRTGAPMFIKSGQSRYDVTIHWKSVRHLGTNGIYNNSQWTDLRNIVAMFKISPFVDVENAYLRQVFTQVNRSYETARMAFALRQLRIDTDPNTTNVIDATLTMTLFNYSPYSLDFAYADDNGNQVDASQSGPFKRYIQDWIDENMDSFPGADTSTPGIAPWDAQEDGTLKFTWRKYICMPIQIGPPPQTTAGSTKPAPAIVIPAAPAIVPVQTKAYTNPSGGPKKALANQYQAWMNDACKKYNLDVNILTAQCIQESGGKASIINKQSGAAGLMQFLPSTFAGVPPSVLAGIPNPNILDAQSSIYAGAWYMNTLLKQFGQDYPLALAAYNWGGGHVRKWRRQNLPISTGMPKETQDYIRVIMANAGHSSQVPNPPAQPPVDNKPPVVAVNATSTANTTVGPDVDPNYAKLIAQAITQLPPGDWWFDHYTDHGIFFFQETTIKLVNAESQDESDYALYPYQFSVVMVNNLPLIPLRALTYPTYQHVGPPDTMISIAMTSIGYDAGLDIEPEHGGIEALTQMSSTLDNQFLELRLSYRKVSSIHRMQAVFIENQVLNLLGIAGVMIRGITTESVPDVSNMMQVNFMASQYENIFEERKPFRVNGLPTAYQSAMEGVMKGNLVNTLTPAEKTSFPLFTAFSTAWKNHDESLLLSEILRFSQTRASGNYLNDVSTPTTNLVDPNRAALINSFSEGSTTSSDINTGASSSAASPFNYPGIDSRILQLNDGHPLNYADYFVLSSFLKQKDPSLANTIKASVEAGVAPQRADIIEAMYKKLYDYELAFNPSFGKEMGNVVNSPVVKPLLANAAGAITTPSQQVGNNTHGCYRDLGLSDVNEDPDNYFFDYSDDFQGKVLTSLYSTIQTSQQTSQGFNSGKGTPGGYTVYTDGQALPSASVLMKKTNLPNYTMASAFPAFKLFLIEEDNSGPFFAFDNFYSYASVMDMEVIKYQDKPDTAIVQITNLARLLSHRIFDDTAAGKVEMRNDPYTIESTLNSSEATTSPENAPNTIQAGKDLGQIPYETGTSRNLVEGANEVRSRVPFKFFALQTGSKIQIRMGYSNDPDKLFPVFTGQVTQIDGDDILTLTCQSFQLELLNLPGTTVAHNSRWGFNLLGNGEAFGKYSWSNNGDSASVIEKFLGSPAARHFGRWQVGSAERDKMLKGFQWSDLAGKALQSLGSTTLGPLLQTGYDRSGENILVNDVINYDGRSTDNGIPLSGSQKAPGRTFFDQAPGVFQVNAVYSVPKQSTLSAWSLIKDVSRRLPEYNLMVKDYGFPYGADATLVFGHPLDWYYSRPPLFGENEICPASTSQNVLFNQWWAQTGKAAMQLLFKEASQTFSLTGIALGAQLEAIGNGMVTRAGQGAPQFVQVVTEVHQTISGTKSDAVHVGGVLGSLGDLLSDLTAAAAQHAGGLFQQIDRGFQSLLRQWYVYLTLNDPSSSTGRIRPVRRYHYIDHNHIVHNGIKINEEFYNAIKMKNYSPLKANQNIPDHHTRVLDVSELMNDPEHNVYQWKPMRTAYGQSFLKEELSKMYQGDLVLRGVPEIEPFDVILIMDVSTGMIGPIEVESVIHSFNLENGFITIVKPRLLVLVNESISKNDISQLGMAISTGWAQINNIVNFVDSNQLTVQSGVIAGVSGVAAASGVLIAATTVAAWGVPVVAAAGGLALLSGFGLLLWKGLNSEYNPFEIIPLTLFGRPWVGGLQGFNISDFFFHVGQRWDQFFADEIAPTIESWRLISGLQADYSMLK